MFRHFERQSSLWSWMLFTVASVKCVSCVIVWFRRALRALDAYCNWPSRHYVTEKRWKRWMMKYCLVVQASQVCGGLPVLTFFGLGHSHVDALEPFLRMFLILSFQHVGLAVCEDLEGSGQPAVTSLLGDHLNALNFAQFDCVVVQLVLLRVQDRRRKRCLMRKRFIINRNRSIKLFKAHLTLSV